MTAYERANVERAVRKKKEEQLPIAGEESQTFIGHSIADVNQPTVKSMTEEENTEINYEAKIEAIQAELVLANSRVAEFEAQVAAKAEEESKQVEITESLVSSEGHAATPSTTKQRKLIQAAKKRATQRFTSLVTAKKSRLAEEQGMREHLGKDHKVGLQRAEQDTDQQGKSMVTKVSGCLFLSPFLRQKNDDCYSNVKDTCEAKSPDAN